MLLRFGTNIAVATMNFSSRMGRTFRGAVCAASLFFVGLPAFAQLVGNPASAQDNNAECMWQSTLVPNPTKHITNTGSDIIVDAFKSNPAFNINSLIFSLDPVNLTVLQYLAWVNVQPAMTVGAINRPANDLGEEVGGAAIGVRFEPAAPLGRPTTIHWLQVVRTNAPIANLPDNVFVGGDGFNYFIDNLDSKTTLFYDVAGGAANGTHFIDRPFNRCPEDCNCNYTSTFHLFVAEDAANGQTKVYRNGIEWGFNFQCVPVDTPFQPIPEASTVWGAGSLLLLVAVRVFGKRARLVSRCTK